MAFARKGHAICESLNVSLVGGTCVPSGKIMCRPILRPALPLSSAFSVSAA